MASGKFLSRVHGSGTRVHQTQIRGYGEQEGVNVSSPRHFFGVGEGSVEACDATWRAAAPCTSLAMLCEWYNMVEIKRRGSTASLPKRKARQRLKFDDTTTIGENYDGGCAPAQEIQNVSRGKARWSLHHIDGKERAWVVPGDLYGAWIAREGGNPEGTGIGCIPKSPG